MKKIIRLMFAAAMAGVFSAGCASGKGEAAQIASPVIKLGTYNIRCPMDKGEHSWENRASLLVEVIQKNNPDMFGVQEAEKNQIDDILRGVPQYKYAGGGRYDHKDSGEHSCIFYNPERFELLGTGTFTLSEQPDVPGSLSWDTKSTRIATWAKFIDKNTGKKFCYYNTHLDFSIAGINGAKMIVEHIRKHGLDMPLLFSGDFNAENDSEVYRIVSDVLTDSASVSAKPHQGPIYTFQGFGKYRDDSPIDYIFVTKDIRVLSHVTEDMTPNGKFASDHYPVFIEFVLP